MRRFEDKAVLITGAASGIGRETALRLGREGARLVCADVQAAALDAMGKEVRELGVQCETALSDVSDEASVEELVRSAVAHLGKLDVLCNIAGILRFDNTHQLSLADWNRILSVNLTGTFLMCRAAIPHLLQTRGNIVNMSSSSALRGHPWTAAYSASKGGVLALSKALAIEYGKQGVRVNAICPGGIETPIHQAFHVPEGANAKLLRRIMPFTGMATPDRVATTVAFLASDEADRITGEAVRVDGGMLS
jgi:NAD(P)-dependent dehydrogenase (short-subunit alcohol dehydrogenase family)